MVLVCNDQKAAIRVLDTLQTNINPASQLRLVRMHGRNMDDSFAQLKDQLLWQQVSEQIMSIDKTPELGLGDDAI